MAMLSSEVSILILTYMSVERFFCIICPFKFHKKSLRHTAAILTSIWSTGVLLSTVPLLSNKFGNFYGSNGICFPLHIHDSHKQGWEYSAFIFLGVNFSAFTIIALSYLGMFISIHRTQKHTSLFNSDMSFAKRFFFIVFADALCWIPAVCYWNSF